jgi:hypothetical protein
MYLEKRGNSFLRSLVVVFHQVTQAFQSGVQQEADIGDALARDLGDLAVFHVILKLQADDFLLSRREPFEQQQESRVCFAQFRLFGWASAGR